MHMCTRVWVFTLVTASTEILCFSALALYFKDVINKLDLGQEAVGTLVRTPISMERRLVRELSFFLFLYFLSLFVFWWWRRV